VTLGGQVGREDLSQISPFGQKDHDKRRDGHSMTGPLPIDQLGFILRALPPDQRDVEVPLRPQNRTSSGGASWAADRPKWPF